tara:strand:- start:909 stop:1142 length:234 start_codon:yes stop_codon:yes gene_type:complete
MSKVDQINEHWISIQAARIEELEAQLAVAGKALHRLLNPPNGHPHIEAATKEEWAVRAMNAEAEIERLRAALSQNKT